MNLKTLSMVGTAAILAACGASHRHDRLNSTAAPARLPHPYLGQPLPGLKPERFAPGIVCTDAVELNGVFSPNGREFYFTRLVAGLDTDTMHQIVFADGKWGKSRELLLFPDKARVESADMAFSADGQELYFLARHALAGTGPKPNYDLWRSHRVNGEWAQAHLLRAPISTAANELYPVLGRDGSLYFSSDRDGANHIYRALRRPDGGFDQPQKVELAIKGEHGAGDMCLAPDESYLVISLNQPDSLGRRDLYVSFKHAEGGWGELISLGAQFNTEHHEWCPMVTPDGKYLFFSRWFGPSWEKATGGDVYWVDAQILDQFRPKGSAGK